MIYCFDEISSYLLSILLTPKISAAKFCVCEVSKHACSLSSGQEVCIHIALHVFHLVLSFCGIYFSSWVLRVPLHMFKMLDYSYSYSRYIFSGKQLSFFIFKSTVKPELTTTSKQRPPVNNDQRPPKSGPKCYNNLSTTTTLVHFDQIFNENLDEKLKSIKAS